VLGLAGENNLSPENVRVVKEQVNALEGEDVRIFTEALALKSLVGSHVDIEGIAELCSCLTHTEEA
jgi:hypothetical protein